MTSSKRFTFGVISWTDILPSSGSGALRVMPSNKLDLQYCV